MRRQVSLVCAALALTAATAAGQSLLITALTVEDLAYSTTTGRLYAVLPAGTGGPESSVAELDPAGGAILTRIAIPAGPAGGATQVALTDDGAALYVGVDGGTRVRRYALPALIPGPEFALGVNAFNQPYAAVELLVAPGASATLVIGRAAGVSGDELAVYDNGVPRPARVYGRSAAFVTATLLIETGFSTGRRFRLEASGIVADTPAYERFGGYGFTAVNGLAYDFSGGVTDVGSRQLLGSCNVFGYAAPAPDLGVLFYFGSGEVWTCAASTYVRTGRLAVSGLVAGFRTVTRTGTGRFALLETSGRFLVADGFTTPLPPPPPPAPGYPWQAATTPRVEARLTGCTVCRPGDTFSVDGALLGSLFGGAGEIKAAIILPGGAAIGATALGTSHVVLRDIHSSVAATLLRVVMPAGLPPGLWHVEMALLDPATGAVWSRIVRPVRGAAMTSYPTWGAIILALATVAGDARAQGIRTLPLRVSALVAEPVSGRLFAAIPAEAGATGNSVVAIDPVAGTAGAPVFVGSDPTVLAPSSDGQFLYVGLGGASAVRRYDVASGTAGPVYPLTRVGAFDEPEFARRILPVPGSPDTIVVAQSERHSTHLHLVVYDAGVPRPARITTSIESVVLVDATTLVASGPGGFSRIALDATGVTLTSSRAHDAGTLVAAAGGLVFGRDGRVFDAASLLEVRRLGVAAFNYYAVHPVPSQGRAYRFANSGATIYDLATLDILGTLPLDPSLGEPRSWVPLAGGFAYHTDLPRVVLVGDFGGPAPAPPPATAVSGRVDLLGCVACAPGATFHAAATFTNALAVPVRVEVKSRVTSTSGLAIDTSPFGGPHAEIDLPPGTRTVTLLQGGVPPGLWSDWRIEMTVVEPVSGRIYATSSRVFTIR